MSLKDKLNNNELTIGSWITLGHSAIGEIMARAGFDWLVIDMEHSVIGFGEMQGLIQVIELNDVAIRRGRKTAYCAMPSYNAQDRCENNCPKGILNTQ